MDSAGTPSTENTNKNLRLLTFTFRCVLMSFITLVPCLYGAGEVLMARIFSRASSRNSDEGNLARSVS